MNPTDPFEFQVTDRKSFAKFIELLRDDLDKKTDQWENNTLESFLDALQAYTNDLQGYYNNAKPQVDADKPDWGTFADILRGAVVYE